MSVIQSIRDRGAWIVFAVIALALIAFILQDGMGSRGGSMFGNTTTLGKVNGVVIDREEFDRKLTMYTQGGQERSSIMGQLWDMEVNKVLLDQQAQELGLTVTGKEVADVLFGPQSPLAREQQFVDENGQFKADEARQAFAQLKKSKNDQQLQGIIESYIDPIKQQALNTKYQNLIAQAAYAPTWLIEKQKAENSLISSISYVYVPYTSIADSTIKVSDDDVNAYVKKHPSGFEKKEETRAFSYVSFNFNPSSTDSVNILNQISTLKTEFSTTEDVKSYLSRVGSDLPYLDGYTLKSAIKMQFADSITKLADGATFGPYLDGGNYVVARMMGRRTLPDSVKVRHILVKTEDKRQGVLSDSAAKKRIDSVQALASAAGADFNALVQKYSDDGGSKATKGEYDFTLQQYSGISKEFADAIFYGKAGDRKVVKVENDMYAGYHYIEVISQKNFGDAVKVAYLAKAITASNETVNAANTAALQFAASVKDKKQFDEAAAKLNKQILITQEVKQNDFTIANFGQTQARSIVRWLFDKSKDAVSEPLEIGEQYIVGVITQVNKVGLASAASARPGVEGFIRNEKKAKQIIDAKFKGSTLEEYATSTGTSIGRADSLTFTSAVIPALGYDLKFGGAAFNANLKGKVSSPIAGNSGVIALRVENIGASANPQDAEALKQQIIGAQKNVSYRGGTNALKNAATIKDNRSKFY
jgi:peptidyl-prolyl cis-trans isomerase D